MLRHGLNLDVHTQGGKAVENEESTISFDADDHTLAHPCFQKAD